MPTYVLEGSSPVRLPRGPFSVSVSAVGAPVIIDVVSQAAPVPVIRPAPHLLVVPRLDGRTVLRVSHAEGGAAFPPGSSVALTLGVDRPGDHDPARVQLPATDVSGLVMRDLVEIDADGSFLLVRATATLDEAALPELASRARAAARQVLGVDRVPAAQAVLLVVALDASASVQRLADGGAVEALLDVLRGVARVVALEGEVSRVALVAEATSWVAGGTTGTLLDNAVRQLQAAPAQIGFRSAQPALRGLAPDENVVVYLLSDGVPADILSLVADGDAEGEVRHLVIVAPPGGAGGLPRTDLPVTTVELTPDADVREELLANPSQLVGIVRSLLDGCFAPGTELEGKVRR